MLSKSFIENEMLTTTICRKFDFISKLKKFFRNTYNKSMKRESNFENVRKKTKISKQQCDEKKKKYEENEKTEFTNQYTQFFYITSAVDCQNS